MNKREAEKMFKDLHEQIIETTTPTTVRCVWNDFVDGLYKSGHISEKQAYNWDHPNFIKR